MPPGRDSGTLRFNAVDGPLRVLVIGAGPGAVHMHMPVLARLRDRGRVTLALVCDIDRARAASARQEFGFLDDAGDAAAALRRGDIEAVYVFGSAQMHYEYGLSALRSSKHVFVEKPIAPSHAQACDMARAAREEGRIAVGGHNRRFYESLAAVQRYAGEVRWRFAEAVFHKPEFGKPPPFGARTWLWANGVHALDALLFMMGGLPEHVSSLTGPLSAGAPDTFSAIMRWRGGGQGAFLCNNTAGSRRESYVFHGIGETYTVTEEGLTVEKDSSVSYLPYPAAGGGLESEHEAFLDAIRSGVEPPHSIAALAPSLFLTELIERGFSGPVRLPPVDASPRARAKKGVHTAILVERPKGLEDSIRRLMPGCRLVTLDDVRRSPGLRADISGAILGGGSAPLPVDILVKLPRLAVVGIVGLSLKRYDPYGLLDRGIALVNASSAYADSVAEFALGLAILARRRAFVSHQVMRDGGWGIARPIAGVERILRRAAGRLRPMMRDRGIEPFLLQVWRTVRQPPTGGPPQGVQARDLRGSTVGLIGWGSNARAFAIRLTRAQIRVLVYSEHAAAEDVEAAGAQYATLGEVLAADIVSLHRGLTERTRHFLGSAELAKLRPGSVLINIARGGLIEPSALLARLRRGDVFACLDTFEEEPLAASHPLRRLPNVFLTSHIAGGSSDMQAAAVEEVVGKVAAHLGGGDIDAVSAARLGTMT